MAGCLGSGLTVEQSRALAVRRAIRGLVDGQIRERSGNLRSSIAVEAWEAWARRNRKRFAESFPQLLDAALTMAPGVLLPPHADIVDSDLGFEAGVPSWWPSEPAPMPLGAVRASVGSKYWEPDPEGRWLATLPLYEAREPSLWSYADRLAWLNLAPTDKEGRARWLMDFCYIEHVEPALLAADCEDCPVEIIREAMQPVLDEWCGTTVATRPRWLDVADIVAWDPKEPAKWWVREGGLDIVGWAHAEQRLEDGKAVRVYATPAAWNEAGAAGAPGCCVLNWKSGRARRLLIEATGLTGDSTEHGEALQKLAYRAIPRIFVAAAAPG
jgi:hypothetical protein